MRGPQGELSAHFAVNCGGLFADELGDEGFYITPRRGEFVVFAPGSARLVRHILLPIPMLHLAGIRSTGLSSCLGLSAWALGQLAGRA